MFLSMSTFYGKEKKNAFILICFIDLNCVLLGFCINESHSVCEANIIY